MSIVVVTNKFFIKAKQVINVAISENVLYDEKGDKTKCNYYSIQMFFVYEEEGPNKNSDTRHISVEIADKAEAYQEFMEIVKQIRDQNPDDAHMNKLFEAALTSSEEVVKNSKTKVSKKKKKK